MTSPFSFWFIPQKSDEEYLSVIIRSLCNQYQTTPFLPHITICRGVKDEFDNVIKVVEENVRGIKPFTVNLEKIGHSREPKKTLFIQLQQNVFLKQINENLSNKFHNKKDLAFSPHVSLIYKTDMKEEDKIKEVKRLTIKKQFLIDRIAVMKLLNPEEKIENAKWQILFEKQL